MLWQKQVLSYNTMNCDQYKLLVSDVLTGIRGTLMSLSVEPSFDPGVCDRLFRYLTDCINYVNDDQFDTLSEMRNRCKDEISYLSSFGGTDSYQRGLVVSMAKQIRAITTNAADILKLKKSQGRCAFSAASLRVQRIPPDFSATARRAPPATFEDYTVIIPGTERSEPSPNPPPTYQLMTQPQPDYSLSTRKLPDQRLRANSIGEIVGNDLKQQYGTHKNCLACKHNILHCKFYPTLLNCCSYENCYKDMCAADLMDIHGFSLVESRRLVRINTGFKENFNNQAEKLL